MQDLGLPKAPIVSVFDTIQQMNHYVWTVFGDFTLSFGGIISGLPFHGVGQGNGAGPAIWAVVSMPLLDLMRAEGYGTVFQMPLSGESIHLVGYAFVDDADIVQPTCSPMDTAADVVHYLQEALACWVGGLTATVGAIVPQKSHWILIDFTWPDGCWKYATKSDSPG